MEIIRQNRTRQRGTGLVPLEVWDQARLENNQRIRPLPYSSLLDPHFSIRCSRKANNDQTIDFEGRNYEIATTSRKAVTILHHPALKFWSWSTHPRTSGPII